MKKILLSVSLLSLAATAQAGVNTYHCTTKFTNNGMMGFKLEVKDARHVTLSSQGKTCKPVLDPQYDPRKYHGYVRYNLGKYGSRAHDVRFESCKAMAVNVYRKSTGVKAETFASIKLPAFFARADGRGAREGLVVLSTGMGDEHGRVMDDKFSCEKWN